MIANVVTKIRAYRATTVADAGAIRNEQIIKAFYAMCEGNGIGSNIQMAIIAGAGAKFNSGNFSKLYSIYGSKDAIQATALNQPYLAGNIAPNERYAMLNPSGSTRSIAYPTITYTATDPWSVTFIVQLQSGGTALQHIIGKANDSASIIGFIEASNLMAVKFINEAGTVYNFTNNNLGIIGKKTVFTLTADGAGNLSLYRNGALIQTISAVTSFVTTTIIKANSAATLPFFGRYYTHIIRSGALTAAQVTAEYNFFRSIYPEIATVQIGTQEWATSNLDIVCTPQGNVFPEITDNANVSIIASPNFLSGWNTSSATIVDNNNFNTTGGESGGYIYKSGATVIGKWYKCTISGSFTGSNLFRVEGNAAFYLIQSITPFSITFFFKADYTAFLLRKPYDNATVTITALTLDLVGWSGLTEVYDAVYAATAGTAAVKDQAGCLAASAWCHYNNDSANGAIYGKLYNWYAARTLQYDIDAYNTANPTTPWGYRISTQTDFATLQTTLGGSAVAGGKMKKEGLNYWTTPNTGADNSSGFTALPCGYRRDTNGSFAGLNTQKTLWTITLGVIGKAYSYYMLNNSYVISGSQDYYSAGNSIRLIKG